MVAGLERHTHTQENDMSKTPYEIRLELLRMANEILVVPIHQKRQTLSDEYHSKLNDANRGTLPFPTMPDFPSSTDIVAKAEELKKFVDQA
jgi:hypothetical protein